MTQPLLVLPHERREGFWANVRGHVLQLADPSATDGSAPTPDDLLAVSIASELAMAARRFLRERGLPDHVSVAASWQARGDPPGPTVELTVTVSPHAEPVSAALAATLAAASEAWRPAAPAVGVSLGGADEAVSPA